MQDYLPLEGFLPHQSFVSLQWPPSIVVTPLCSMSQKSAEKFCIYKKQKTKLEHEVTPAVSNQLLWTRLLNFFGESNETSRGTHKQAILKTVLEAYRVFQFNSITTE